MPAGSSAKARPCPGASLRLAGRRAGGTSEGGVLQGDPYRPRVSAKVRRGGKLTRWCARAARGRRGTDRSPLRATFKLAFAPTREMTPREQSMPSSRAASSLGQSQPGSSLNRSQRSVNASTHPSRVLRWHRRCRALDKTSCGDMVKSRSGQSPLDLECCGGDLDCGG